MLHIIWIDGIFLQMAFGSETNQSSDDYFASFLIELKNSNEELIELPSFVYIYTINNYAPASTQFWLKSTKILQFNVHLLCLYTKHL